MVLMVSLCILIELIQLLGVYGLSKVWWEYKKVDKKDIDSHTNFLINNIFYFSIIIILTIVYLICLLGVAFVGLLHNNYYAIGVVVLMILGGMLKPFCMKGTLRFYRGWWVFDSLVSISIWLWLRLSL